MTQPLSETAKRIISCCRQGQFNQLLELLETGLALDEVNHPDFMPLNVALRHGRWKIAKHLLENQLIPLNTSTPALIAATQYKKDLINGLELVFSHTADSEVTDPNGRTALMTACLLGHEKKVKYLLNNPECLHAVDHLGMNAFLDAVISQSVPIIELLIDQGADLHHRNTQGDNALLIASATKNPSTRVIKTLLDHGVSCSEKNQRGKSAYDIAEKKHPQVLKLFITKIEAEKQMELPLFDTGENTTNTSTTTAAADVAKKPVVKDSSNQAWFAAVSSGNLGQLNRLKINGTGIDTIDDKGCSALIHAAGKGHRAVASFLLQNQANIEHRSANGSTPLSSAIISNSRAVVGLLLKHGANPNGHGPGDYPYIALAAAQWNEACISMLIDAGAQVTTQDLNGQSLYHQVTIAAEYYSNTSKAKSTLRVIHQHGLDPNTQNQQGNTALHVICGAAKSKKYAVDDSHIANIAHELLKLGCNPKIVNNEGFTAIQYAKKHALLNTKGVILSFIDAW